LIDPLTDEVCGEALLESFLVFKRIVNLCVRHARRRIREGPVGERRKHQPPRFEPAVEYFLNTFQNSFPLFRRDGDMVDALAMKVSDSREPREFL
jgi:hypothetical protein